MFYSHEVLTSRKYGVATVWLVATLGSKSGLKKVSRKAILDVDVQKACKTIETPDAPMALRLQSNLLYGVTRVYAQQCGFVLSDVEAARNNMRMMFKVIQSSSLNAEGNKARADQLVLQDDPNFLPDFDLMPLELGYLEDSQRSTLSPHHSQLNGSHAPIDLQEDIGGLIIPQSASSFTVGGPIGGFGGSLRGDSGAGPRPETGGLLYEDDAGIHFSDDGNLLLSDTPLRQLRCPSERAEQVDQSAATSRVRPSPVGQPDEDGYMPLQDDDYIQAPDAEMLPVEAPGQDELRALQETSEESAQAPIRRRKGAAHKALPMDTTMELHNRDLASWNHNYVANMNEALRHKNIAKANVQAKKNAEFWMLGQSDRGPLSIFQGAKLLEALTGVDFKTGEKRTREVDESDTDRRVRARGAPSSDEVGRGNQDDGGFMPMMEDDYTIEQGREAPTPLDDRHHSSLMPWSQQAGSRRPTSVYSGAGHPTSASFGGPATQLGPLGRRGSRLVSASPLQGRGTVGGDVDDFQLPGSGGDIGMTGAEEFELYGVAANVDTQTAAQSQWQRAALDGESMHFLEFVQAGIQEQDQARAEAALGDEDDEKLMGSVDFETLLPPREHSRVVAAQALLHVLTLGTRNLLKVEQEEAFGAITMRAIASTV